VLGLGLLGEHRAQAGGPLIVGGTFGPSGQPFLWSTATEVQYRTDGGNLGILSNATANQRVAGMFQVWEDVPTAAIGFNRAGSLLTSGAFVDGDISTAAEFNAVDGSCGNGQQSPIIYDADGSLFASLGLPGGVIGFAGPCALNSNGQIVSAEAALNGKFRDGNAANGELSDNEFDAVFIHEFGHFFGLDHSQINLNCLIGGLPLCSDFSDDAFGLPTMFPFLISGLEETPGVHPARTLSTDDIAWVSRLYPAASFNSSFGTITGTILFSDGQSPAQGVNVIARRIDNPRRFAVSVVSGFRFTNNPGQPVTGNNPGSTFGSRDPGLIGTYEVPGLDPASYTVEVESVHFAFAGGSSVGPLDPPIPSPGPNEFFNFGESPTDNLADSSPLGISSGSTLSGINVILNGTPQRFDPFEPSDSISGTAILFNDGTAGLSVSPFADQDFYSFQGQSGMAVTMVSFAQQSSRVDTVLELLGFNGIRLNSCRPLNSTGPFEQPCLNDDRQDQPGSLDSALNSASELRDFFVHIVDFRGDGRPDFQYSIGTQGVTNPFPPSRASRLRMRLQVNRSN
jgi:hypothetical protein